MNEVKEVPDLATEVKRLNKILTKMYKRSSAGSAFLIGIFSGLGSVIGATLVVAIVVSLLSHVQVIPILGNWIGQIAAAAVNHLPQK